MPQTIPANSMIMSPPSYVDHPHPSYYISVNMNCFTPTSYITTIRRGGWDGDFVGNFEMGISAFRKPNTVCFRDYECPLGEMLEQSSKMFRSVSYLWKSKSSLESTSLELYWEESTFAGSSVLSCFLGKEKMITNVVAKFIPSTFSRRPGRMASDLTRLEVSPQGHDYLDDIVVSVLVIERIRTSPNVLKDIPSSMLKELF
ncbi:hypothetical protein B0H34DRAFT_792329 [Crassisporium funariophilum]|nr:hypothetical protein B0H34DRAFT_792329 [Crassisporium funariophilum]